MSLAGFLSRASLMRSYYLGQLNAAARVETAVRGKIQQGETQKAALAQKAALTTSPVAKQELAKQAVALTTAQHQLATQAQAAQRAKDDAAEKVKRVDVQVATTKELVKNGIVTQAQLRQQARTEQTQSALAQMTPIQRQPALERATGQAAEQAQVSVYKGIAQRNAVRIKQEYLDEKRQYEDRMRALQAQNEALAKAKRQAEATVAHPV